MIEVESEGVDMDVRLAGKDGCGLLGWVGIWRLRERFGTLIWD